jgi:hypothetical protein
LVKGTSDTEFCEHDHHHHQETTMKHTDVLLSMARQQEREFATAMQRARAGRSGRSRIGRLPRMVGRLVAR